VRISNHLFESCQVVFSLGTVTVSATLSGCTLTRYCYCVCYTVKLYSHSILLLCPLHCQVVLSLDTVLCPLHCQFVLSLDTVLCPLHCQFVLSLGTVTVSATLSGCTFTRYGCCVRYAVRLYSHSVLLLCPLHCQVVLYLGY